MVMHYRSKMCATHARYMYRPCSLSLSLWLCLDVHVKLLLPFSMQLSIFLSRSVQEPSTSSRATKTDDLVLGRLDGEMIIIRYFDSI